MKKVLAPLLFVIVALMVDQAGASVVSSIPGGTVTPMPVLDYFGGGPITFGSGITWSSTNCATCVRGGGSVFGYTLGYDFLANGVWVAPLVMAGVNSSNDFYGVSDTMTFTFASPIASVGGFLNYVPGNGTLTTIAVYDAGGGLIESYDLTFVTDGSDNSGAFYGFQESSAIIKSFTLTDNFIGITNLTTAGAVPEPSSILLIGTGLLGAFGYGRRRLGL